MSGGIWLARQGETDANAEGRVQGTIDPPLNDRGREQARELAREASSLGLRALYTSQLRRARETAEIVGEELGLEPRVDARFAESDRGEWEGRLAAEIRAEDPDGWAGSLAVETGFRFPGGESLGEHAARVGAALEDAQEGPLPALLVCHGGTIRCAVALRDPRGLDAYQELEVPNAALIRLPAAVGEHR